MKQILTLLAVVISLSASGQVATAGTADSATLRAAFGSNFSVRPFTVADRIRMDSSNKTATLRFLHSDGNLESRIIFTIAPAYHKLPPKQQTEMLQLLTKWLMDENKRLSKLEGK